MVLRAVALPEMIIGVYVLQLDPAEFLVFPLRGGGYHRSFPEMRAGDTVLALGQLAEDLGPVGACVEDGYGGQVEFTAQVKEFLGL